MLKEKNLDKSNVVYSSLESFNRHFQTILFYVRSGIIQQVLLTSVALYGIVPPQLVFSPPLLSSAAPLPHACVSPPPAAVAHAPLPLYAAVPLPPSFSGKTRHHTQHKRHLWVNGECSGFYLWRPILYWSLNLFYVGISLKVYIKRDPIG